MAWLTMCQQALMVSKKPQLHGMMDNVRMERTGNPEQGKQIDPNKFMPKMAQGGIAQAYNNGGSVYKNHSPKTNFEEGDAVVGGEGAGTVDPNKTIGQVAGTESSLSNWAGDYVVDLLGQGKALGNQEYQSYEGPISAGASDLQEQAFTGGDNGRPRFYCRRCYRRYEPVLDGLPQPSTR
jgi:hypothetical protein